MHHVALDTLEPRVVVAAYELTQRGGRVGRGGLVQAGRDGGQVLKLKALRTGNAGRFEDLFVGGAASVDGGQFRRSGFESLELLANFEGDANGATVLLNGALQRLANPPGGVRRELESTLGFKLLYGAH